MSKPTPAPITISYTASVMTPAGWRGVEITAKAVRSSPAFAIVEEVLTINGEPPSGHMSRSGSRRQGFNGTSIAAREVGHRKRLSSCVVA